MAAAYDITDLEDWDARIREKVAGVRPRLLPAGVRDLRPQPDARVHGVLGHAVALPALVVRQGLREAEDALRLRRLRPAVRDGHQLQPGARLPDARQLAAACRSSPSRTCTATTTSSRTTSPSRARAPSSPSAPSRRTATASAATSKTPASGSRRSRSSSTRRTPSRCSAGATSPSASARRTRSGDDILDAAQPPVDPFQRIHRRQAYVEPDLRKVPLVPDEDLLLFIRDHNPYLAEWEKDLLTIVHEEAQYFIPQIETKIMNEGWATYWHKRILDSLELPQDLQLEFIVRHNQVVRPFPRRAQPVPPRPARLGRHPPPLRRADPGGGGGAGTAPPDRHAEAVRGARGRPRRLVSAPPPDREL